MAINTGGFDCLPYRHAVCPDWQMCKPRKKGSPEINRLLSTNDPHNVDVKKGTSVPKLRSAAILSPRNGSRSLIRNTNKGGLVA